MTSYSMIRILLSSEVYFINLNFQTMIWFFFEYWATALIKYIKKW